MKKKTSVKKSRLFLRYLVSPLYLMIPSTIRIVILFLGVEAYDLIARIDFKVIVILILLGVVSIPLAFYILYGIGAGLFYLGKKIMQFSPNKIVFWIVFSLCGISFLDMFIKTNANLDPETAAVPLVVDIIVTVLIMTVYGIGGYVRSKEEEEMAMQTASKLADESVDSELPIDMGQIAIGEGKEIQETLENIERLKESSHYPFVHHILRDLALKDPGVFSKMVVEAHKSSKDNAFIELWERVGGSADELEKDSLVPRFLQLRNKEVLIAMKMPKVKNQNEASFIGVNLQTKRTLSFYTLELTKKKKYALCKWEYPSLFSDAEHSYLKDGLESNLESFHWAIADLDNN